MNTVLGDRRKTWFNSGCPLDFSLKEVKTATGNPEMIKQEEKKEEFGCLEIQVGQILHPQGW